MSDAASSRPPKMKMQNEEETLARGVTPGSPVDSLTAATNELVHQLKKITVCKECRCSIDATLCGYTCSHDGESVSERRPEDLEVLVYELIRTEPYESRSPDGDGPASHLPQRETSNVLGLSVTTMNDLHRENAVAGSEPADSHPAARPALARPPDVLNVDELLGALDVLYRASHEHALEGHPWQRPNRARTVIDVWLRASSLEHVKEVLYGGVMEAAARIAGPAPTALDRPPDELEVLATAIVEGLYKTTPSVRVLARDYLDLRKAPALARPAWQDIETAPKTGLPVILGAVGEKSVLGFWSQRRWQWLRLGADRETIIHPTHWQALPPPPTENL